MAQLLAMAAFSFEGGNLIAAFRGQQLVNTPVAKGTPALDACSGVTPRNLWDTFTIYSVVGIYTQLVHTVRYVDSKASNREPFEYTKRSASPAAVRRCCRKLKKKGHLRKSLAALTARKIPDFGH